MESILTPKKEGENNTQLKIINRIYSMLILAILLAAIVFLVYITKRSNLYAEDIQNTISLPTLKNITNYVTKFQF